MCVLLLLSVLDCRFVGLVSMCVMLLIGRLLMVLLVFFVW